jgi:hypothetical protein
MPSVPVTDIFLPVADVFQPVGPSAIVERNEQDR